MTGKITLLRVATLPAEVAPAVADSDKYLRVFSSVLSITAFLVPVRPSTRADLVSCQRPSNSSDILVSPL